MSATKQEQSQESQEASTWMIVIVVFCSVLIGFIWGSSYANGKLKTEAIELNYAQYDAVTGEWEWRASNDEPSK